MHLIAQIGASKPLQSVPTRSGCMEQLEPRSQGIEPRSQENFEAGEPDNSRTMSRKCPRSSGPHESNQCCKAAGSAGHFAMEQHQMAAVERQFQNNQLKARKCETYAHRKSL